MSYEVLCLIWFLLLGILLAGYAVLDGFDLGVGLLHPFVPKNDLERRLSMNSIGPLWDGNEVWLVTFGGAMFAMFPEAYKTIFSSFYTAFILLLFALIFRAVSMEFRSKIKSPGWRHVWDYGFFVGSGLAALLFGVAIGNGIRGIPLNENHDYLAGLWYQLHPYNLMVGLMVVAMFAMHGGIYLYLKTEGDFQKRLEPIIWRLFFVFLGFFLVVTIWTLIAYPDATKLLQKHWWMGIVPVLNLLAIANIPRAMYKQMPGYAFISSSCSILAFVFLFGVAIFPNMVPSTIPGNSVTIYEASSPLTLKIGLLIVLLGMPCVLAYTTVIYWTFRGKVKLDDHSY